MADIPGEGALDKFSSYVTQLNPDSLLGILDNPLIGKIWIFLKWGIILAVIFGVVAFILKKYMQYRVKLTIHKNVGKQGCEILYDVARVMIDEQGKQKLMCLKTRKDTKQPCTCPVPEAKFKAKKGKADHYFLFLDDNLELHPIDPPKVFEQDAEIALKYLRIRPQERDAWSRLEKQIILNKFEKKDKFLQYAAPAIMILSMVLGFLILFFASREVGAGLATLASTFRQIASSCSGI